MDDNIVKLSDFEQFLKDRIKVNGATGNTDAVQIHRDRTRLQIVADAPFSKRYIKYLTKKFLKSETLRDFFRVVSTSKNTYEFKYFNINENNEEES